jgi:hypothetical protein
MEVSSENGNNSALRDHLQGEVSSRHFAQNLLSRGEGRLHVMTVCSVVTRQHVYTACGFSRSTIGSVMEISSHPEIQIE